VVAGPIQGSRYDFDAHDTFLFGRAPDCHAVLPLNDTTASRHHFLLEVNPPAARLRDLGSLNGTWVNGTRHGGRALEQDPGEAAPRDRTGLDLHDGDQIRVGATLFTVHVKGAPVLAGVPAPQDRPEVPGYELGRLLGRGGMGEVYQARRARDGQAVALKLMRPEAGMDAAARAVFLREIEVTARLQHPNIVALLEHGLFGDTFFFAMELCPGGSLAQALWKHREPLSMEQATPLALAMLQGLAHAHAQGVVHRDLKPENVLLMDAALGTAKAQRGVDAWAKVADFGLAKSFEQAGLSGFTATGVIAGTLFFMPREQLTSFRRLRPQSDVWSLGATIYHMLTQSYPRNFRPGVDPLQVILEGRLVPLRERAPTLPEGLAAVVDRAVSDDLEVRYRDGGELLAALREVV
jgi:eukaryotic-like serine/threonine-protein kinase